MSWVYIALFKSNATSKTPHLLLLWFIIEKQIQLQEMNIWNFEDIARIYQESDKHISVGTWAFRGPLKSCKNFCCVNVNTYYRQWALAQTVLPPSIIMAWRVKVMDSRHSGRVCSSPIKNIQTNIVIVSRKNQHYSYYTLKYQKADPKKKKSIPISVFFNSKSLI